jgi:uncharacterized RDD family membrane protein YckC
MQTENIFLPEGEQIAPIGRRALAAVTDAVFCFGIWFLFIRFFGHYNDATGQYEVVGLPALCLFSATAAYWILQEWLWGRTLGKAMLDLRVVSLRGRPCSFSQSLKRNVLRILDFFGFYLVAYIAAKLNPWHQRLGDQWARTLVVWEKREVAAIPSPESPAA